jgi:hypothetical protein
VTVTLYVPFGVLALVAMVSVADPPAVTDVGLNVAVAPLGRPDALSDTVCAEPAVTAVETVAVADEPAVTLPEVGDSVTEKSFVAVVQVGSPDCAGTLTAFHAAFTTLNSAQLLG